MSNCLCLACDRANPLTTKFCTQCGAKLQIQERYRALKVIGQGGFGKTFLAQDEGKPSKPRCVIKQFIYNDPSSLQKAQELFEQEAVRLDDLGKHSQIPELFAHCDQDGRQYLVQEFIDGENLLQELNGSGRFSEAKIKDLLLDLLPVLQFIHTSNVIHRDIKPENIIRRRSDGKLVLVDFGAAKVTSQTALAKTGTEIGSAEYTAPEQARGKAVFASDIYALGVTCIYLLTQIPPFDLFSDHEDAWVWRQFLNGNVVGNRLGVILDKMLAKALGRRYQSVSEILQIFQPSVMTPETMQPVILTSSITSIQTPIIQISQGTKPLANLSSSENIDYSRLEYCLKSMNWGSANQETTKIILKVAKREKEGWLDPSDINDFPCEVLQTIDNLWVSYSNGKFGFSIQAKVWIECGGKIGQSDHEVWQKFRSKVSNSDYDYKDPKLGQLPEYFRGGRSYEYGTIADFSKKITECNLTNPTPPPLATNNQILEFEFEYILTKLQTTKIVVQKEEAVFMGLRKKLINVEEEKKTVFLEYKKGKAKYISKHIGNGVTIDLIYIPAGKFIMGSNENNERDDETPTHEVVLREFWMGKYTVTQKQWQAIMGNNPSQFKGDNLPVDCVSWNDATEFCKKFSQKIGKKFRLPTEAEWEYACRAGSSNAFNFGNSISPQAANYESQSSYNALPQRPNRKKTVEVDSFYPNQWGLYQMHGNIWEWCLDKWHKDYNSKPQHIRLNGNEAWIDLNKDKNRPHVLRGGAWCNFDFGCRSAVRHNNLANFSCNTTGFRIVLDF